MDQWNSDVMLGYLSGVLRFLGVVEVRVDEVHVFIAPLLAGGASARGPVLGVGVERDRKSVV